MTVKTLIAPSLGMPLFGRESRFASRELVTAVYVTAVIAGGAALLATNAPREYPHPALAIGLLCASLALSAVKLRLPLAHGVSTLAPATAVNFLALMVAGTPFTMVMAAAGSLLQCTVRVRKRQPIHRTAFSVASLMIAVQVAGWVWHALRGSVVNPGLIETIVPLSAVATTFFVVNTGLVAGAIALSTTGSPARAWHREFLWSAPSYFLSAVVAGVVAVILNHNAYALLPLAAIPLYISYHSYQISVRRIEEERRHAQELAAQVATTEEALALLALAKARLAVTVETISDGVVTVDMNGSVLLMNDAAQSLTSLREIEMVDLPVGAVFESLGLPAAMYQAALQRVLGEGQAVQLRNDAPGCGPSLRLVEITGTPTRDGEGDLAGAVWVLRDVSDAARLEHERSKASRLESLGVLAGGLAHDFNNILIGVVGNLSMAQTMVRPGEEALLARLTRAEAACVRARGVTNQLLTFAKGGAPVKTAASMHDIAVECTRFALTGSPVAPRFAVDPELWVADVDSVQIGQVVQNLVLNAMQAMPRGGVVDVALQNVEVTPHEPRPGAALPPGKYVCLTVEDHGPGIRPEHLGHIFDPYFTTKEKGSGLGLAISYSIVRAHGGAIAVASEPGQGSRFSVYLPASMETLPVKANGRVEVAQTRSGRILLMDDDAAVAEVTQDMLESLGYATQLAASGRDAIDQFREAELRGEPFDAVILDLTVPGGMGGGEAVPHIKDLRPDVPVVVASGYADDPVLARFRDYGFDGVLPKPFGMSDLRRALEEASSQHAA